MIFLKFIQIDLITCNGKQTQSQNTSYYFEKINVLFTLIYKSFFLNYLIPICRKHKFGMTKLIINAKKKMIIILECWNFCRHFWDRVIARFNTIAAQLFQNASLEAFEYLSYFNLYNISISERGRLIKTSLLATKNVLDEMRVDLELIETILPTSFLMEMFSKLILWTIR